MIDKKKRQRVKEALRAGKLDEVFRKKLVHDTIREPAVYLGQPEKPVEKRMESASAPKDKKELNEKLVASAKDGNVLEVLDALDKGADVDYVNGVESLPEFMVLSEMLQQGTALIWAAEAGHTEVVRLLLTRGADVNARDAWGERTALMFAAKKGSKEIVELLLRQSGVEVNARAKDGSSALWYAMSNGHKDIEELLKQHGARLSP